MSQSHDADPVAQANKTLGAIRQLETCPAWAGYFLLRLEAKRDALETLILDDFTLTDAQVRDHRFERKGIVDALALTAKDKTGAENVVSRAENVG